MSAVNPFRIGEMQGRVQGAVIELRPVLDIFPGYGLLAG